MKTKLSLITISFLLITSCGEEAPEMLAPSFENTQIELAGKAGDEVSLLIPNYNGVTHQLTVNGKAATKLYFAGNNEVRFVVPPKCGSGFIELTSGTNKIQGPWFNYIPRYVHTGTSFGSLGSGMCGHNDASILIWNEVDLQFQIVQFKAFQINSDVVTASWGLKSVSVDLPDSENATWKTNTVYGVAKNSLGDIYFHEIYKNGNSILNHIMITNLDWTEYYAGGSFVDQYNWIHDIDIDSKNNIYTCEENRPFIQKTDGSAVTVFAGTNTRGWRDGAGSEALFGTVRSVSIDAADNLFVADSNCVRMITPVGEVTTVAGSAEPGDVNGLANDARFNKIMALFVANDGAIYIVDGDNGKIKILSSDLTTVSTIEGLTLDSGLPGYNATLYVDSKKNIYLLKAGKQSVIEIYIHEDNINTADFEAIVQTGSYSKVASIEPE